jgi:L-xylulokinase
LQSREMSKRICLTGGAARSEQWVQIFADVFQVPVEIPAGTELGALGAAICAAVAVGRYASYEDAVGAMVKISHVQNPDPTLADVYARKYECYKHVIDALGPVWKHLG